MVYTSCLTGFLNDWDLGTELQPGVQSSSQNENLVNDSEKLRKTRSWSFPVMGYFTRNLEIPLDCRDTQDCR